MIKPALMLLVALPVFAKPSDVWLAPARRAELQRVTQVPYITSQERQPDGRVIYRWKKGTETYATTQAVVCVLGAKSKSAWQDKLDAKEKEKKAILDDLKAVKDKPSKKQITDIIDKHSK